MKIQLKNAQDDLILSREGTEVSVFEALGGGNVIETTYANLVSLKNGSNLKVGAIYRITDYATTTNQGNTSAATHNFDVLVVATDVDTLDENAKAIKHASDTYFANAKLEAWEIKYSLANDTNRFAWADSTNGKGVIYYMKDEFGNEAPYDFKNIMFKRKYITAAQHPNTDEPITSWGIVNKFCAYYDLTGSTLYPSNVMADAEAWLYTFTKLSSTASSASITDYSIAANGSGMKYCYENKIELFADGIGSYKKFFLNNIVIVANGTTDNEYGNVFGANCRNITLYNANYGNTFGTNNYNMTFGNGCGSNTFGNNNYSNTFGNSCGGNTFGNGCDSNTFGNSCYYNSFGNGCRYNSFGNGCDGNTFGNYCQYNSFGNYCQYNSFGNNNYSNTFGNNVRNCQIGFGYDYAEITDAMQVPNDLKYWELVSYYSDEIEDGDDYTARLTLRSPYDITLSRTVGVNNDAEEGGETSGNVTLEANKPQTFDYTLTTSDTDGLVFTWGFSYTIDGKNVVYNSTYEY